MKKYIFEAAKKQWEKPTEPKYVFCPEGRIGVFAETEEEALALAKKKLREGFLGTAWTVVMDLTHPSVTYYARRHFDKPFYYPLKRRD